MLEQVESGALGDGGAGHLLRYRPVAGTGCTVECCASVHRGMALAPRYEEKLLHTAAVMPLMSSPCLPGLFHFRRWPGELKRGALAVLQAKCLIPWGTRLAIVVNSAVLAVRYCCLQHLSATRAGTTGERLVKGKGALFQRQFAG